LTVMSKKIQFVFLQQLYINYKSVISWCKSRR
jgi:hypothetical protein